jgi:hypothetical protein
VLVAQDIALVKHGASLYPCLTYWASSKGREALKKLRGYKKGGDFIEYFNETGFGEYSFANVKGLVPLDQGHTGRNGKKFELLMASAQAEQSVVDSVVEVGNMTMFIVLFIIFMSCHYNMIILIFMAIHRFELIGFAKVSN